MKAHLCRAILAGAAHRSKTKHLRHVSPGAHGIDRNTFHQPLAKGLQAVERVHQIFVLQAFVIAFESCPEADRQQRVELAQVLLRLCALEAVRLVNDKHRANDRQRFHEAFGMAEQIGLDAAFVDGLAVTGKRLVGGDQYGNARIRRVDKPLHRPGGVVVDADFLAVVLPVKKSGCGLQAFQRALPDGIAGYQHNEL